MANQMYIFLILISILVFPIQKSFGLQAKIEMTKKNVTTNFLSRKRRYLVFPEGASFLVSFSWKGAIVIGDPIFTEGVTYGMSFDLPEKPQLEKKQTIRRNKRDVYRRIEGLINTSGMNGRNCVLRTICETSTYISPRQGVIEEIIRFIFTYESTRKAGRLYSNAHSIGMDSSAGALCPKRFPCPISLLDVLLNFAIKT